MADTNDGSLIFDTELDESGFEKGTNRLMDAIKDLTRAVDNMGDNMMASFGKVIPLLQTVANSAAAINERLTGTATQTADANEKVIESEQRVSHAAEEAATAVNQQSDAASTFAGAVNNTQHTVSALEKEVNSLSSSMQSVSQSAEMGFANGKAVLTFDSKIQDLEQRLEQARERLTEFGNTSIPTQEYNDLTAQISRAEQALFRLYDRRDDMAALGVKENSKQWERLTLQIENAESQLERYERARDALAANGGAFIQGSDTAEYSRMEAALNGAGEVLNRNKSLIDQEALAQARLNVLTAQEAVAAATTTEQREAAVERLRAAQEALAEVARSMSNNPDDDGGGPTEAKISMWARLGSAMKTVGSTGLQVAATLAKIPFTAAAKGVQKLAGGVKSFINHAKNAKIQANALVKSLTSLKRMLITRIKRMFISGIFNEAKESLQTLAKFSDTFNQSMSNIKNSSKQLSANLAVSLGNLVNTLAPMITGLLDTISRAITYLNALFAMLGGKTTMTVAKKQTDSYRDSLDGAAKSAEELKNQVYGFDELNKRSGKDDSGVTDGSDLFEEVPIDSVLPDSLKDLFAQLKELWENGDYYNFGKKLAELFNTGLQTLDDWFNNVLRPKGTEWAKNIAEIFNGLVDGIDWKLLGKTVADGMNAIFDIVNTFLTTFNFENLGKGMGEAINGWFDNIEWDLIATTFANGFNAIVDTIHGLVTTVNWAAMGDSIAKFVQTFFTVVDWNKAADTISAAINGIVTAFQHLIDGVNWKEIGTNLATSVSNMITGIDWGAAFKAVSDAFAALEDLILGAIQGIDWRGIAASLADGVNNIDVATLLTNAGKIVSEFITGVLEFATQLIESIDWSNLTQKLWDGLVGIVQSIDFSKLVSTAFELLGAAIGAVASIAVTLGENIWGILKEAWESVKTYFSEYINSFGGDIVAGLWEGIKNAFANVGTWIKENIFDPFINGFKNAFGINSPSTVMMEMGRYIVEGLLQGIKNIWNSVTSWFSTALSSLKNTITTAWTNIKTATTTAWEGIKSTIQQKFEAAKTALSTTANNIKTSLSQTWNDIKSAASTAWENLKSTVSQKFDSLKSSIANSANTVKTNLSQTWSNIQSSTSTAWNNIKSSISTALSSLQSSISSGTNSIRSAVQNAWSNIQSSTTSAWNSLKSNVMNLWNGLKSTMQSTDWSSVGSNLVSGLQRGISNMWSSITSTVSSLARSVTSTISSIFGIHSPSKVWAEIGEYLDLGLKKGLEDEQGKVLSTVSDMAKNINEEIDGEKATLQIGAEGDDMVSRLGAISDKLADIVGAFRSINTMLAEMGGIRIPVIASGTEVPYKTRVGADSTNATVLEMSSDLDETLSDHTYLLRQILDLLERAKFGVDNDELAQAIAFALRGAARGYGGV